MKVNAIQPKHAQKTGKTIGTIGGLGAGGAYVIKNRKDIFVNAVDSAIEQLEAQGIKSISKNKALLLAGGIAAAAVCLTALVGRAVGGTIGKMIDKHNAKKAAKLAQEA